MNWTASQAVALAMIFAGLYLLGGFISFKWGQFTERRKRARGRKIVNRIRTKIRAVRAGHLLN